MSQAFKNIRNDVIKVVTMNIVVAVLAGKSLQDKEWQTNLLNTLIGFATYELVVTRMIDLKQFGQHKATMSDILKVGTMLIVTRLLAGGDLSDASWLRNSAFTLAGFTAYNMVTSKMVSTGHLKGDAKQIADDWVKVGTMLVVSHLLKGGNPMDNRFLQSSLNTIVGFNAGDMLDYA